MTCSCQDFQREGSSGKSPCLRALATKWTAVASPAAEAGEDALLAWTESNRSERSLDTSTRNSGVRSSQARRLRSESCFLEVAGRKSVWTLMAGKSRER